MNKSYYDFYAETFAIPLIKNPLIKNKPAYMEYITAVLLKNADTDKLRLLQGLSAFIIQRRNEVQDNGTLDELMNFEETMSEVECIVYDMCLPIVEPPTNYPKLFHDLMRLQGVLQGVIDAISITNQLQYYVSEMRKCIPRTAGHHVSCCKNSTIRVYYNRLLCLAARLEKEEFHYEEEVGFKRQLLECCGRMSQLGCEPMVIPSDSADFFQMWERCDFDNRDPMTLYPRQSMYRSEPFLRHDLNTWTFSHRDMLGFMSGAEYWRRTMAFQQLDSAVQYAFWNYVPAKSDTELLLQCSHPADPAPEREWDLTVVPKMPSWHVFPNPVFERYYNTMVSEFCEYAERSNTRRTADYLPEIYIRSVRIRAMSDWMGYGAEYRCDRLFWFEEMKSPPDIVAKITNVSFIERMSNLPSQQQSSTQPSTQSSTQSSTQPSTQSSANWGIVISVEQMEQDPVQTYYGLIDQLVYFKQSYVMEYNSIIEMVIETIQRIEEMFHK